MQSRNEALLRAMIDGTGKGELEPAQSRIEALLYELMDKIDGGGGGGSGGGLVVTIAYDETADGHFMNKTWQEIHDAMAAGQHVSIISNDEIFLDGAIYQISACYVDYGEYQLHVTNTSGYFDTFTSSTAGGYPKYQSMD